MFELDIQQFARKSWYKYAFFPTKTYMFLLSGSFFTSTPRIRNLIWSCDICGSDPKVNSIPAIGLTELYRYENLAPTAGYSAWPIKTSGLKWGLRKHLKARQTRGGERRELWFCGGEMFTILVLVRRE
ncbi:reverse transcriptase [Plakobranchus ocellatus]|uniref:Reverse transcriptase n=1 Tax=Plakobranchus ocellatus TaxID=259542 RepID=A0AAV4DIP2_9GAST|nr:reverse transcriptase [Plakobranchus ocellatus]